MSQASGLLFVTSTITKYQSRRRTIRVVPSCMFSGGVITMSALGDPARVPKMMPPPTSETATGGWERRRILCKKLRSECEIEDGDGV